ncbi:MAG: thioredoxin family protein [Ottowia sp.]|nr:thioredoxin family protein [Ottowia sp.]
MKLILFCAEWCGSCREFKTHFNALKIDGLSKHWLDIEDNAELVDEIEIDNLPTIFAVSADGLSFYFGEIPPNKVFLEKILSDIRFNKIPQKPMDDTLLSLLQNMRFLSPVLSQ